MIRRREFLRRLAIGAGASLGAVSCGLSSGAGQEYPHSTLEAAFAAAGYDPAAPGSAHFVVVADCHYGKCAAEGLKPILAEVEAMRIRPAFFLIDGDMIITGSLSFGHRPNAEQRKQAVAEFKLLKRDLDRFDRRIPVKLALGNHDTPPDEIEPELFHQVFPDYPAYQAFDLAGTRGVILNGHGNGHIEPAQRAWLCQQARAMDSKREVLLFVHQPSLGSVVNERGIAPAIREAFAAHEGPLWLICGHSHNNSEAGFRLPRTTIVQVSVVNSTAGVWGGAESPGYWIYGVRDGHVQARIFRRLGQGYRMAPPADRSRAAEIREPFEGTEGILWRVLVGEGDREYLVAQKAADVETFWFYVKELTYRLPLQKAGGQSREFAILGQIPAADLKAKKAARVTVSADNAHWEELPLGRPIRSVYRFPIPESLRRAEMFYVRLIANNHPTIAGYALLK